MQPVTGAAICCRASCRPRQLVVARLDEGKPRGSSTSPVNRLLSLKRDQGRHPQTVYTLRVHTGLKRGSALDDYNAGVLVCLVGSDGAAYLARLQPLADPESREQELLQVCSSLDGDSDAGANCRLVLHSIGKQRKAGSGSSSSSAALAVKRRFQEGSVDEICFVGPELGPLAGMLIAPEAGRWVLDEVDVSSSRTGHSDRFICREALGDGAPKPAAYLAPVPPGAVVYGSGGSAVVLSKSQAAQLHAFHMQQYSELKLQLLNLTAVLVAVGCGATFAFGGPLYALPFALGGSSALLYQFLLQQGVDGIGAGAVGAYAPVPPRIQPGLQLSLKLALANPFVRMALTGAGLLASFGLLHTMSVEQTGHPDGQLEFYQILSASCGFLTYKLAILIGAFVRQQQSPLLSGPPAAGRRMKNME